MEYNLDTIPNELKSIIAEKLLDDPSPEIAGRNLRALQGTTVQWKQCIDQNTRAFIDYRINQYSTSKVLTSLYIGTPTALQFCQEYLKKIHEKNNKSKEKKLDRILRRALRTYSGSRQNNIIIYELVKNGAQLITPDQEKSYLIIDDTEKNLNLETDCPEAIYAKKLEMDSIRIEYKEKRTYIQNNILMNTYKQTNGSSISFGIKNSPYGYALCLEQYIEESMKSATYNLLNAFFKPSGDGILEYEQERSTHYQFNMYMNFITKCKYQLVMKKSPCTYRLCKEKKEKK